MESSTGSKELRHHIARSTVRVKGGVETKGGWREKERKMERAGERERERERERETKAGTGRQTDRQEFVGQLAL